MGDNLPRRKRFRTTLRVSLLALFALLMAGVGLLFPWSRDVIGAEAAESLLHHFKERGDPYSHVVRILGEPGFTIGPYSEPNGSMTYIWLYDREAFLSADVTMLFATFDSGKIKSVSKHIEMVTGTKLWQQRWNRLRERLSSLAK
jgi:hypothetical protein